jgi:hypothetical protein
MLLLKTFLAYVGTTYVLRSQIMATPSWLAETATLKAVQRASAVTAPSWPKSWTGGLLGSSCPLVGCRLRRSTRMRPEASAIHSWGRSGVLAQSTTGSRLGACSSGAGGCSLRILARTTPSGWPHDTSAAPSTFAVPSRLPRLPWCASRREVHGANPNTSFDLLRNIEFQFITFLCLEATFNVSYISTTKLFVLLDLKK